LEPLEGLERDLDVGEVSLRCTVYDGPHGQQGERAGRGELVALLHGFPECGKTWRRVATGLAAAGYRVVAPDMRGYGGSDRPKGIAPYGVQHLVRDVAGLVRAMGAERAHVVGHDWGGVVAWWTAMLRPDVVGRLAVVNAAHPVGYAQAMKTAAQLRRGWYVLAFQVPWLPEWAIALRDYAAIRDVFSKDGIAPDEADPCVAAIRLPGARTAALAYYRAAFRAAIFGREPEPRKIELPTLVVWGEKDHYLEPSLAEPPGEWVAAPRVVRLPRATHWAHIDASDDVVRELVAHFR
jgi:pimeloyl-ACP methyl ester carboxylesterase